MITIALNDPEFEYWRDLKASSIHDYRHVKDALAVRVIWEINTTITMGEETPWRQVNRLLIDAALKTGLILDKLQPFVQQTMLNAFSASYQLYAYTKHPRKQAVHKTDATD